MNKKIKYVLLGISLFLCVYLIYIFISNYELNNKNNVTIFSNTNSMDNFEKTDPNIAIFNEYSYEMLPNFNYKLQKDVQKDKLIIYSNGSKWGASISLIDKTKQLLNLFSDYDMLENKLKQISDKEIKNKKIINVNKCEAISFEEYGTESNNLIAYMPAYDDYEFEIILFAGDDKTFNYDALNGVVDILCNGKKIEK